MADVNITSHSSNGVNGEVLKTCNNCIHKEIHHMDFPCVDCISLSRWNDPDSNIEDIPNETDGEEFVQRCGNCKHKLESGADFPCIQCNPDKSYLSKWEQEESCGNCKYENDSNSLCLRCMFIDSNTGATEYRNWNLDEETRACINCKHYESISGNACIDCRGTGTDSHWESKEEVRPRSCSNCQYGDRNVSDMNLNPRECYMCYGTKLKKNWKNKEENMDIKMLDYVTNYVSKFTDSNVQFDNSIFDDYLKDIMEDEGIKEGYSTINKEYFPDKIDEKLMKRIMKDLALRKDLELQVKEYKDMEGLYLQEIEELTNSKKALTDRVTVLEQTLKDADISTCEMLWEE